MSGNGSSGGGGGGEPAPSAAEIAAIAFTGNSVQIFFITFTAASGAFVVYNLVNFCARYVRRLATMNSDMQKAFVKPNALSGAKRHLFQAPLLAIV